VQSAPGGSLLGEAELALDAERVASAGGRFLAYLLQRDEIAALALNVAMCWHPLGPTIGDVSHLDRPAAPDGQNRADRPVGAGD
jgi:hypothetical protein